MKIVLASFFAWLRVAETSVSQAFLSIVAPESQNFLSSIASGGYESQGDPVVDQFEKASIVLGGKDCMQGREYCTWGVINFTVASPITEVEQVDLAVEAKDPSQTSRPTLRAYVFPSTSVCSAAGLRGDPACFMSVSLSMHEAISPHTERIAQHLTMISGARLMLAEDSHPALQAGQWHALLVYQTWGNHNLSVGFPEMTVTLEHSPQSNLGRRLGAGGFCVILAMALFFALLHWVHVAFDQWNHGRPESRDNLIVPEYWPWDQRWRRTFLDSFIRIVRARNKFLVIFIAFGIAFASLAGQLSFGQLYLMTKTGDRDICYLNEKCYYPSLTFVDVPVNTILSHWAYVAAAMYICSGLILVQSRLEREKQKVLWNQDLFEALVFVIFLEGLGSIYYHVCPSLLTFQFDEAFMTPITHLCTMAMVRGHFSPMAYFVNVLGPLWFFNSVGSCFDVDQLPKDTVYVLFMFGMLCWASYVFSFLTEPCGKVHELTITQRAENEQNGIPLDPQFPKVPIVAADIDQLSKGDTILEIDGAEARSRRVAEMLLDRAGRVVKLTIRRGNHQEATEHPMWNRMVIATVAAVMALSFWVAPLIMQALGGTANLNFYFALFAMGRVACREFTFERERYLIYVSNALALILAVVGVSIFLTQKVNDVLDTPAKSRLKNKDCVIWPYYDIHDVWHILSAVCLGEFVRSLLGVNIHREYYRPLREEELNGVYTLETVHAEGKYLHADGIENGANVQVYDDPRASSSHWRISRRNGVYYTLENVNAIGRYLSVADNEVGNGANVQISDSPRQSSSQWRISSSNGLYTLESVHAEGKYLDVDGNQLTDGNGANVHLWGNARPTWRVAQVQEDADAGGGSNRSFSCDEHRIPSYGRGER
eukprot:TRINITY_DN87100_c0_g1_i1.p1 TRINITY_DN87100_c0_g1~~TRINITY_DN87100_c0_g1_i1.p1  ORF type:complete len:898 (+),score=91.53 TRINITY_DN87100_c0_g1_i1:54-2696(+)